MNNRVAFLSVVTCAALMFTAAQAAAAAVDDETPSLVSRSAAAPERPWTVRAEGSLVNMRDNWLGLPGPEVGLAVSRDLTSRFSVELAGASHDPGSGRRSWSAMAAARGVLVASSTRHHALTVAAGPFVELSNPVHGTIPFAHAELAYVYRSSFGLTVLAGGGPLVALASSSYVTPPSTACPQGGDAPYFCVDLGPDAQELHAGDVSARVRVAVGWAF